MTMPNETITVDTATGELIAHTPATDAPATVATHEPEAPAAVATHTPPTSPITGETRASINAIAVSASRQDHGFSITPQSLGEVVRFADVMSRADVAIPKHLRGNAGACAAVTMQALRWGMEPYAVASKTYMVGAAIAYEAQLIMAVINMRAGFKRRPVITYAGAGPERVCTVVGEFFDGSIVVYESPIFAMITPKNSPLWKSDPDQQLAYYSVRAFGRRYCPEVILGVYDAEELQAPVYATASVVADVTADLRKRGESMHAQVQA